MRLRDLFSDDATIGPQADTIEVNGLAFDSRAVKPGEPFFFALAGYKTDGSRFIDCRHCVRRGGVAGRAIIPQRGARAVPFVVTPNPRRALALAAARFFPRQPATIAAVHPAPAARRRWRPLRARSGSSLVTPRPASAPSGWSRQNAPSTAR